MDPSVFDVPRWMRVVSAPWPGQLALVLSAAALGGVAWLRPPADAVGWALATAVCLAPSLVFRWGVRRFVGRGTLRCPDCWRLTQHHPRTTERVPGMSEPHLRCDHCGSVLWGL